MGGHIQCSGVGQFLARETLCIDNRPTGGNVTTTTTFEPNRNNNGHVYIHLRTYVCMYVCTYVYINKASLLFELKAEREATTSRSEG